MKKSARIAREGKQPTRRSEGRTVTEHPSILSTLPSVRGNNPWFLMLFLGVYALIMAFVILS
ncbi:MAG: hypothetical protein ACK4LQ_02365 [Pararhodobacter sp.]